MDANSILLKFFVIIIAVWLVELAVIGIVELKIEKRGRKGGSATEDIGSL